MSKHAVTLKQFIKNCPHTEVCICPTCKTQKGCRTCYKARKYTTTLSQKECFNYKPKEEI